MDDLEPAVSKRDLPGAVRGLREDEDIGFMEEDAALHGSICKHIDLYSKAVERVIRLHEKVGSDTDIVIGAHTRWSAIWELSGRCLAECRLLVYALRGGFALESSANMRAILEAIDLLGAIAFDDETTRRWLAGEYIRPKTAKAVMAKRQALAHNRMQELGVESDGDLVETGAWLYDYYSKAAHHRRGPIALSVSVERREFAYGPHPDPRRRAREVSAAGQLIETALIGVIAALAEVVGPAGLRDVLNERATEFEHVRQVWSLDVDSSPLDAG